jgi:multicomponent Na+:H+ antiporter subunit G
MTQLLTQSIAILVIVIGTAFSVIGMIGFLRLPDVYTRLHATGKVSTFGVVLLLVAAALLTPVGWAKAVLLIALVLIAGPVVSHAISSAAYRVGIPMQQVERDDLTRDVQQQMGQTFGDT